MTPLAKAVRDKGLTPEHVARRCGVEKWTLSRWFRGASQPDEAQQLVLGALLNLDREEIADLVAATASGSTSSRRAA